MKLTKRLLAMALAGVMLLTILTGCSGGKTGDRLVEEYMATWLSEHFSGIPVTHDVPEIKTVAGMFDASWLKNGSWDPSLSKPNNTTLKDLQKVFAKYNSNYYTVTLVAFEVDSKRSELDQAMRVVMSSFHSGLQVHSSNGTPTAIQCATRLVTKEGKSYRIAVIIYDYHAAG